MDGQLVVVTVVKDDPEGLLLTLASAGQSNFIDRWLIIDGSERIDPEIRSQALSLHPKIEYVQSVDDGPYSAMNNGLKQCSVFDYVWFMNAGDEFASLSSIRQVKKCCLKQDLLWLTGPTIVQWSNYRSKLFSPTKFSAPRYAFGQFPAYHQSIVASSQFLNKQGGFDERYHISADYKATLQLALAGPPAILTTPLSIYKAGGISDQRIDINIRQQSEIRKELMSPKFPESMLHHAYDIYRKLRLVARQMHSFLAVRLQFQRFKGRNREYVG